MLIEIHMIQNHSPSNLNRDDLGAPKTCVFGGVTRARISSQCLKRSIRNPTNPDDVHKHKQGMFAKAMAGYIGIRTKFFPWLVEQALLDSDIPTAEHPRIVLAAQRIAMSKEKDEKRKLSSAKADPRPKTRQLIHLGPGHAQSFVAKLAELRIAAKDPYDYFLNPVVGFQEMVRELLVDSGLEVKDQDKIVKAAWIIAKCRMSRLLKDRSDEEPPTEDGQPGAEHADLVASILLELHASDPETFKELTKSATNDEKSQLKDEAPEKPKKMEMDKFMAALKFACRHDAVDIALFGRMTTSDAFEDVEASMQVAHAISTHAVANEVDYFTAVDDLSKAGAGAGHVDEAMFNSACFYKYFCLDWEQLVLNLNGPAPKDPGTKANGQEHDAYEKAKAEYFDARKNAERLAAATLGHFILAAASTTPSGKQNSSAANNKPSGILVEIKKEAKMPTSYANAFAEPARRIGNPPDDASDCVSLVGRSIAQFGDHVYNVRKAYGITSTLLWHALPLNTYPLQAWEREEDGRRKRNNGKELPPVPFTEWDSDRKDTNANTESPHRKFPKLGGEDGKPGGLVEAVIEELALGFTWEDVQDAGKASGKED